MITNRTRIQFFSRSGLVAALAAVLVGCGSKQEAKQHSTEPVVIHVQLHTVAITLSPEEFTASGTVRAALNATLSSKVMGRVTSVFVHEGDSIHSGQQLVSLDARELEAAVAIARAGHQSTTVGVGNAKTVAEMESGTSNARIVQAEAQVAQAESALAMASAKYDLAVAGPRKQEVTQSHLAVVEAESTLKLALVELNRMKFLVEAGAIARRELDIAQNRYDVAKGRRDTTLQGEQIAREGTRTQDIRASAEAVAQAKSAIQQAKAGLIQAKAAAMQTAVRRKEVEVAQAQVEQSAAALRAAQVGLSYANVVAPFDGKVVQRRVDPGSMASPGVALLDVEGGALRLEATVPEDLLKKIHIGSIEPITIDALGGVSLSGRVSEILPQAERGTHSYLVKWQLAPDRKLRSGMFGRVRIEVRTARRMMIPPSATWERDGLHYVHAVDSDGTARLRIVTVGQSDVLGTEVLSGLNSGDRIAVGKQQGVSDGTRVEARKS